MTIATREPHSTECWWCLGRGVSGASENGRRNDVDRYVSAQIRRQNSLREAKHEPTIISSRVRRCALDRALGRCSRRGGVGSGWCRRDVAGRDVARRQRPARNHAARWRWASSCHPAAAEWAPFEGVRLPLYARAVVVDRRPDARGPGGAGSARAGRRGRRRHGGFQAPRGGPRRTRPGSRADRADLDAHPFRAGVAGAERSVPHTSRSRTG